LTHLSCLLAKFAEYGKINIFVFNKTIVMKKILAFAALVGFLTACSQYTCPTYSKKEVKKDTPAKRI
jgi:hypothetical protein